MTHTKTITIAVAILIVAILGYVALQPGKTDTVVNTAPGPQGTDQQETEQSAGKKMAFSQFMKQGGSYKCTVYQYVNDSSTQGIVYLNDGLMRGEYSTTVQGKNIDATVIVRDGYAHTWTSMSSTMGFKSKIVEDPETGSAGTTGTYSYSADQIGDYDCQPWTADASLFVLPAEVSFKEV